MHVHNVAPHFRAQFYLGEDLKRKHGIEFCPTLRSPAQVAAAFSDMARFERETMIAGTLDCKCRLVNWMLLSVGTSDRLSMRIADAFQGAIRHPASGIFLAHNHPSGSLAPSEADLDLTRDVAEAGVLLGYPLLDHVIITRHGHRSIMTAGMLQRHRKRTGVVNASLKEAAEPSAAAHAGWRCSRCGTKNVLVAPPSIMLRDNGLCTLARCRSCKGFLWLKNG